MNPVQFPQLDFSKNIWITSDIHAWHKNYCKGSSTWSNIDSCRDFPDQFVMTEKLISNINRLVMPDETLLHFGDWSFGGRDNVGKLRDRISCQNVFTILGNHDHHIRNHPEVQNNFIWVGDYLEFRYKGILYCCSHYPFDSWNEIGRGSVMLHGHCHHSLAPRPGRRLDVGIDGATYHFSPISLDFVHIKMMDTPIYVVDHHDGSK